MKILKYILFSLILLLVLPTIVLAAPPKMSCTYEGQIPDGDATDINIKVTITLGKNNKFVFSNPVLTTSIADDVIGCRKGDLVSDCYKVMSNVDFKIDYVNAVEVKNGYYTLINDGNAYTNFFVKNNKYTCPNNLTMLKHETEGIYTYSLFFTPDTFSKDRCGDNEIDDFTCQKHSTLTRTGSKIESVYDGQTIQTKPSSGNCCVYKYGNFTTIYTYKFNSVTGATSYAVCVGNDCMTTEPNLGTSASYMSPGDNPEWSKYQDMSNCNNMPENIWFATVDGKKMFFPYHASRADANNNTVFQATLQPNQYCESKIYGSTGGVPDGNASNGEASNPDSKIDWGDPVEVNCEGIIGQEMLDFINKIFRWIQIIAPIIVIILGGIEFAGAILKDDKDALKKATSKFLKRLIIAIALFFIPLILSWLLEIFNEVSGADSSTCGIGE